MLDVIGAGATAISDRDWHEAWINSKESKAVEVALEEIHTEGRKRPPVRATVQSAFATPWPYQLQVLLKRQHLTYWRNPTYLFSKLTLNIIGGLFIGFTFFKAKDTIQGTQNKLFVSHNLLNCRFCILRICIGYIYGYDIGKDAIISCVTKAKPLQSAPLGGQLHVQYINVSPIPCVEVYLFRLNYPRCVTFMRSESDPVGCTIGRH